MNAMLLALAVLALPAFAKDIENKKSSGISWPVPWDEMLVLRYDVTQEQRKERKDKPNTGYSGSYVATISGRRVENGYEQSWQSDHNRYSLLTPDPIMDAMVNSLAESTKDKPLVLTLDDEGYYQSLRDADVWTLIIRKAMQEALEAYFVGTDAYKAMTAVAQADARRAFQKQMAPMMDAIGSEQYVSGMLSKVPSVFNDFAGGGLQLGQDIDFEHESENPLGGKPYPMNIHVRIDRAEDPAFVNITVRSRLNAEKASPILLEAVKKLLPELAAKGMKDGEIQALFKQMDVRGDIEYRINTETGIVHYLNIVESKQFPGRLDVETTKMVLKQL